LLALYGVAGFLLAVSAGTPYPSLFHGASQWTRLPFWLQGATVGGLFLVPLALLLEIVTGLRRITRDKISDFAFRVIALAMSLVITVAAIRTPDTYASGDGIEAPPWLSKSSFEKLPQGEEGYKLVSERLNRMYAALDVINSKIDRSLFEIDALADRLGSDPTAMVHFVRDEIRYEPYTGVLRGALGTLLCRAGNALDRSLLLAALLQKAGLTTQIASGHLSSQQAQTLVNRLFEPVKPVPQAISSVADLAAEISRTTGVDQAKLLQRSNEMQHYGEKQKKQLIDYVDTESKYLSDILSKAGVGAGVVTPNDQLLAEASDHYWVQYQNASGQWVDLDSSFTDAEPGKANTQVANTFASDSVPEELYHHLRITLTLRVAQVVEGNDGPTTDTVLLDRELRVAEEQDKNTVVANVPDPMPDFAGVKGTLGDALAATKGFQTVLQVGDKATAGKYFDLKGKISDKLGGPVGDVVTNAGGIGGAFGGLGGNAGGVLGGASEGSTTRIVGEWVDYNLSSPRVNSTGPNLRHFHRDIVSPVAIKAWTAGKGAETLPSNVGRDALRGRLFWSTELLPVTGPLVFGYLGYLQMESLKASRGLVDFVLRSGLGLAPGQTPPAESSIFPVSNSVLSGVLMQTAKGITASHFPGLTFFLGEPALVSFEHAAVGSSSSGNPVEAYDIVAYRPRVVAKAGSVTDSKAVALLRIAQGVLATRAEWMLIKDMGMGRTVRNTTGAFEAARRSGTPSIVLRPGAAGLRILSSLDAPDSVRAELSESLRTGYTLVLPAKAPVEGGSPEFAWWQIDNSSGELIGKMPGGRGQALVEWTITALDIINMALCAYEATHDRAGNLQVDGIHALLCFCGAMAGGIALTEGWEWDVFDIALEVMMKGAYYEPPPGS
jgi:hypothetical protein